jgi:hypothetical protein
MSLAEINTRLMYMMYPNELVNQKERLHGKPFPVFLAG